MFEATRGRQRKIVVYDPIDDVVYSRAARRDAQFHEDGELQDLLIDNSLDALRQFACQHTYGFSTGVVVEQRQRMGAENGEPWIR